VTKTRGFDGPFWMIAVLVLAGTIPVATARWEDTKQEASKNI
jgi:hypothetical protein